MNTQFAEFCGAWTALVTPFHDDTTIDYEALEKLLEHQIA
jgi:dihydrodipicolinate synthase/N-acetylneuraminate lyase